VVNIRNKNLDSSTHSHILRMSCPDVDPPGGSFDGISVLIAFVVFCLFVLVCASRVFLTRADWAMVSFGSSVIPVYDHRSNFNLLECRFIFCSRLQESVSEYLQ
jgi:hypothetical protein